MALKRIRARLIYHGTAALVGAVLLVAALMRIL